MVYFYFYFLEGVPKHPMVSSWSPTAKRMLSGDCCLLNEMRSMLWLSVSSLSLSPEGVTRVLWALQAVVALNIVIDTLGRLSLWH